MKSFALLLVLSIAPCALHADQLNVLGTANSYAVLGATTVTNTGPTVLNGDLGVSPGTSITGFPPGIVNGTIHDADAAAATAQANALSGYTTLQGLTPTANLTGQELGGLILTPGVYFFSSSADLTGALTLDFEGQSNASFVFQIGSTLTTASGSPALSASSVVIDNAGSNDSVYWALGSSGTLGTYSMFAGDIIANTSITLDTGATINCGDAIALHGAVTLDTNNINACSAAGVTSSPVPEPGSLFLLSTGLLGAVGAVRRRFKA